jgi:hypothetical protein
MTTTPVRVTNYWIRVLHADEATASTAMLHGYHPEAVRLEFVFRCRLPVTENLTGRDVAEILYAITNSAPATDEHDAELFGQAAAYPELVDRYRAAPRRSLSVGDVITLQQIGSRAQAWTVERMGFRQLPTIPDFTISPLLYEGGSSV